MKIVIVGTGLVGGSIGLAARTRLGATVVGVDPVDDERFVGGHPLAGGEASGAEHARADLFEGATWYLTPSKTTAGLRLQELHRLLGGLGARPAIVDAATHDRVMAAISHLP